MEWVEQAALTAVLRDDFDFDGTFAAVHEYGSGAPNPCISTKELGAIGLPLSTRDAEALRSQCQEVGGDGSGVWEMKGNDVSFPSSIVRVASELKANTAFFSG